MQRYYPRSRSSGPGGAGEAPAYPAYVERLTQRELDVLQLLAAGERNQEIGDSLCLTRKTVEYHVNHILRKLGAKNRTHAVLLAERMGLIPIFTNSESPPPDRRPDGKPSAA
jgi:DNA-binding NarL/FixJ family response regulator